MLAPDRAAANGQANRTAYNKTAIIGIGVTILAGRGQLPPGHSRRRPADLLLLLLLLQRRKKLEIKQQFRQ